MAWELDGFEGGRFFARLRPERNGVVSTVGFRGVRTPIETRERGLVRNYEPVPSEPLQLPETVRISISGRFSGGGDEQVLGAFAAGGREFEVRAVESVMEGRSVPAPAAEREFRVSLLGPSGRALAAFSGPWLPSAHIEFEVLREGSYVPDFDVEIGMGGIRTITPSLASATVGFSGLLTVIDDKPALVYSWSGLSGEPFRTSPGGLLDLLEVQVARGTIRLDGAIRMQPK